MEEFDLRITARLAEIESRLEILARSAEAADALLGRLVETLEERIEQRRREIDEVRASLRGLGDDLRYEIADVARKAESAARRW